MDCFQHRAVIKLGFISKPKDLSLSEFDTMLYSINFADCELSLYWLDILQKGQL